MLSNTDKDEYLLINDILTVTISTDAGLGNISPESNLESDATTDQLYDAGFRDAENWINNLKSNSMISSKLFEGM